MKAKDALEILRVSRSTLFNYVRNGKIIEARIEYGDTLTIVDDLIENAAERLRQIYKDDAINAIAFKSDLDVDRDELYLSAGLLPSTESGPKSIYVARGNSTDVHDESIASVESATSGVVGADRAARGLKPWTKAWAKAHPDKVEEYIETELTHRDGRGKGYDRLYTCDSKRWIKRWDEIG